ncbi:MAG: hypothetical protein AABY22_33485 [Nanoarchaeota archaeon]
MANFKEFFHEAKRNGESVKTYFNPTLHQEREYKSRKERIKKFYESKRLKGVAIHKMKNGI